MNVLVTGASGFIGSHLVRQLVADGHDVRTFGRNSCRRPDFSGLAIEHTCGDITDRMAVKKAIAGCDIVFHLAGVVSYRKSDFQRLYHVNVEGTRLVMELSYEAGVKRVIYTGSIAGMGIPKPGTSGNEGITYNLSGRGLDYCDSKHAGEEEVRRFISRGLPAVILNPGIIFGEGDSHPHHHVIFTAIAGGWLLGVPAGGVSFCDIHDVVTAHIKAMRLGRVGSRYVLASENLTFQQAAAIASRVLGRPGPRFVIPGWILELAGQTFELAAPLFSFTPSLTRQVAWLSRQCIFFNPEKAVKELGYTRTPFEETVRRTAPYYLGLSTKDDSEPEVSKLNKVEIPGARDRASRRL